MVRKKTAYFVAGALACAGAFSSVFAAPVQPMPRQPAAADPVVGAVAFVPVTAGDRYQDLVRDLAELIENESYGEALEVLEKTEVPNPDDPVLLNMKGAAHTGLREWETARGYFLKALEITPTAFAPRFNMGEVLFLEGNPEESLKYFESLGRQNPENELLEYKQVVLFLLTGRNADAERLAGRMRFPGNSPAWYYAQAAVAFSKKEKSLGKEYLYAVHEIFPEKSLRIYDQTIQESGLKKL